MNKGKITQIISAIEEKFDIDLKSHVQRLLES